jgi:hypothetical protein
MFYATKPSAASPMAGGGPVAPAFLDLLESFQHGRHTDQVDACSGAFNRSDGNANLEAALAWMDPDS